MVHYASALMPQAAGAHSSGYKLEQWARRKYKTLSRHKRRSVEWLSRLKKACPRLFVHWRVFENKVG
jgi:hypothetical protein